jgi:DNA-binding NtrC family response regulator
VVSADTDIRKSLAFVLGAEGFTTIALADLASARATGAVAACRAAIVEEVAPGTTGDLALLPPMPVVVLCDHLSAPFEGGMVRYMIKPVLGQNLIVLLKQLLDPPRRESSLSRTPKTTSRI